MLQHKVLVVEDDSDILELIRYNLKVNNYCVFTAETGEQAVALASSTKPDLILLDLMLPGIDGLEVCRKLKASSATKFIPIIMVTAKSSEADIVTGLELGADDYITKPFSTKVLIARVAATIRSNQLGREPNNSSLITSGAITIDTDKYEVFINSKRIDVTATEFDVLKLLIKRSGRVFTRYQIIDATKGGDYEVTDRAVDVQIVGLRKKLGEHGKFIKTVRGIGYKAEFDREV